MNYEHVAKHSFDHPLPIDARYDLGAVTRVLAKIARRLEELSVAKRWAEELYPDGRHDVARGQQAGMRTAARSKVLQRVAQVRDQAANHHRRRREEDTVAAHAGRPSVLVERPMDVFTAPVGTPAPRETPPGVPWSRL